MEELKLDVKLFIIDYISERLIEHDYFMCSHFIDAVYFFGLKSINMELQFPELFKMINTVGKSLEKNPNDWQENDAWTLNGLDTKQRIQFRRDKLSNLSIQLDIINTMNLNKN